GDLIRWIAAEGRAAWPKVVEFAEGVAALVVDLGGKLYHCVLDTVEKVAAAAEWVFQKVVHAVGDLVKYLQYLFDWDDIKRTKQVMKNLTVRFLESQVAGIVHLKQQIGTTFDQASKAINRWDGMVDFAGLGSAGQGTLGSHSRPADAQSAPGSLLSSHFQANA